jgi:hypothetical protein
MKDIPAFPIGLEAFGEDKTGMTLRDYFAAKAMQGFMGSSWNVKSFEDMAKKAYQLADAMMKEKTDGL